MVPVGSSSVVDCEIVIIIFTLGNGIRWVTVIFPVYNKSMPVNYRLLRNSICKTCPKPLSLLQSQYGIDDRLSALTHFIDPCFGWHAGQYVEAKRLHIDRRL